MDNLKTLVINAGSSSLKYQVYDMESQGVLCSGNCERIGIDGRISHKVGYGGKQTIKLALASHKQALNEVLWLISQGEDRVVNDKEEIAAVGHRIACGMDKADKSCVIDGEILEMIAGTAEIFPLHIPAMLTAIQSCMEIFPEALQAAVFDNSFHLTMPPKAYIYGVPYEYYEKYGVRRYGYHGTSHKYASQRVAALTGRDGLKLVTCHLGNGSSVTAIQNGQSVDTSMGFTPLEGLIMGTRSGSIDPAIMEYLAKKLGLDLHQVMEMLNTKSGFLGISGVSSDDRDLEIAAKEGNKRAALASEIFRYQIKKYIGSYAAVMDGVDAIAFTGGMGEKSPELRSEVCGNMSYLGLKLDPVKNVSQNGLEGDIAAAGSRVRVFIISADEELMIARDTIALYKAGR